MLFRVPDSPEVQGIRNTDLLVFAGIGQLKSLTSLNLMGTYINPMKLQSLPEGDLLHAFSSA